MSLELLALLVALGAGLAWWEWRDFSRLTPEQRLGEDLGKARRREVVDTPSPICPTCKRATRFVAPRSGWTLTPKGKAVLAALRAARQARA